MVAPLVLIILPEYNLFFRDLCVGSVNHPKSYVWRLTCPETTKSEIYFTHYLYNYNFTINVINNPAIMTIPANINAVNMDPLANSSIAGSSNV